MKLKDCTSISVLIPVFNASAFLEETINSVLWQTFTDFEVLLLDDGSTDNSPEIIGSFKDPRIKYIPCPHSFIETLNTGLQLSKGKYIALLDHDDIMLPNRLQIQFDFMEESDVAACGGYMYAFGKYSKEMTVALEHDRLIEQMTICCPMLNPTGFIRRDVLNKYKIEYKQGYSFAADFKFWSDLIKVGKVVNIPHFLTLYRTSDSQASVKYFMESSKAATVIHCEMINYFMSFLNKENGLITPDLLGAIENLGKQGILSRQVYFGFMYELIVSLRKQRLILI